MNITIEKTEDFEGGQRLSTINASYIELVNILGEPNIGASGDKKTTQEWNLLVTDNTLSEEDYDFSSIVTIYDWNESVPMDCKQEWHIGGNSFTHAIDLKEYILKRL